MIVFPPGANPQASILLVGLRDAPLLLQCLKSVAENVKDVSYEVVLVLNDPSRRLCRELDESVSGVRVCGFRANLGFGDAVNYASTLARGRYLVLLNDDCVISPGWLEALVDTTDRLPRCGLVGSAVFNTNGTLQEAGAIVWSDGNTAMVGEGQPGEFTDVERKVDYCSGLSLLVRRYVWERLGGFDDRYYPAYYEDVDLCFRAFEAGWEVWLQPRSVVHHARSVSTTQLERAFFHQRGRKLFLERWAERLEHQEPPGDLAAAVRASMDRPLPVTVLDDVKEARDGLSTPMTTSTAGDLQSPDLVAALKAELSECRERERLHEIELAAARRELELRLAYNASLEQDVRDRQQYTEWLNRHIDHVTHVFDAERQQAAERQRAAEELEAERQRAAEELEAERQRATEYRASLEVAQQTLAAERARVSYRLVQRLVSAASKVRTDFARLRRAPRPRD